MTPITFLMNDINIIRGCITCPSLYSPLFLPSRSPSFPSPLPHFHTVRPHLSHRDHSILKFHLHRTLLHIMSVVLSVMNSYVQLIICSFFFQSFCSSVDPRLEVQELIIFKNIYRSKYRVLYGNLKMYS